MSLPLLTIAIPTFNRALFLKETLEQIKLETGAIDLSLIEIVVSDNCSTDNTENIVFGCISDNFPINYVCNTENFGWGFNFLQCFRLAKGKYVLLLGDDDLIYDGGLKTIIDKLQVDEYGVLCLHPYGFNNNFRSEYPNLKGTEKIYHDQQRFLIAISPVMRAISALVINKQILHDIDIAKVELGNFVHLHLALRAILKSSKNIYVNRYLIACKRNNSFGYNFSKVFVHEYWNLVDQYVEYGIKQQTIRKLENRMLFTYYPFYLLKERLEKVENHRISYGYFKKRFAKRALFHFWVAPIMRYPRPIAILWGLITTIIGRSVNKEFMHGVVYVKKSIFNKNNSK